jgi:hypothetical protein
MSDDILSFLQPASSAEALAFHAAANQSHGCAAVRELFAPLSCRHFTDQYFEQRHHLARGGALVGAGASLLRAPDVERMATHWDFKIGVDHSQARMLLPNSFSHDTDYADGDSVDGHAIAHALRSNRTVVLHNVELYWRPIGMLALTLMRTFGVYSQANVYYSAAGLASAVHAHQDAQSVFIVQCEGRKRWELFAPPQRWRLRYNQRGKGGDTAPDAELSERVDDVTLAPGDVLFVPRGMYHRTSTLVPAVPAAPTATPTADASSQPASLHVTIGVETDTDDWTWLTLLRDAATALKLPDGKARLEAAQWSDEALRQALPLPLCRPSASVDPGTPLGAHWLSHARDLLLQHLGAKIDDGELQRALDGALRPRQDHVERKRLQVEQFMALSPA